MNVPFFTSVREYHNKKEEFDKAINSVLEKGDFILGSEEKRFEEEISKYISIQYPVYTVGVGNGSDALVLGADALEYKSGAEVITPVLTFFASASCITRNGGVPVFCDVDEDSFCMDMNDAAKRITKKTKGLLPVHLFAQMANMNDALNLAKDNNLTVFEDAAEAFGMKQVINNKDFLAGTIGDAGVYSFFPTKTLGGYGDGGMFLTKREDLFHKVKCLRVHGATKKYHHDLVGYNSRLDSLQAAILNVKLKTINESISKREIVAKQYYEMLSDVEQIKLPTIKDYNKPVYYVFQLKVDKRDELVEFLKENEIGTCIYYPIPLHLQKCFSYLGYKKGDFPIAEKLCDSVIALPIYPEITEDEVSFVCQKIKEFYSK